MTNRLLLILLALSFCTTPVVGQSFEWGFDGVVGQHLGGDFKDTDLWYALGSHFLFGRGDTKIGAGLVRGRSSEAGGAEGASMLEVYGILRHLVSGESSRFFVGARAGVNRLDSGGGGVTGLGAGPMVGIRFPFTDLTIEITSDLQYVHYGGNDAEGVTSVYLDSSGLKWAVTFGIAFPIES